MEKEMKKENSSNDQMTFTHSRKTGEKKSK